MSSEAKPPGNRQNNTGSPTQVNPVKVVPPVELRPFPKDVIIKDFGLIESGGDKFMPTPVGRLQLKGFLEFAKESSPASSIYVRLSEFAQTLGVSSEHVLWGLREAGDNGLQHSCTTPDKRLTLEWDFEKCGSEHPAITVSDPGSLVFDPIRYARKPRKKNMVSRALSFFNPMRFARGRSGRDVEAGVTTYFGVTNLHVGIQTIIESSERIECEWKLKEGGTLKAIMSQKDRKSDIVVDAKLYKPDGTVEPFDLEEYQRGISPKLDAKKAYTALIMQKAKEPDNPKFACIADIDPELLKQPDFDWASLPKVDLEGVEAWDEEFEPLRDAAAAIKKIVKGADAKPIKTVGFEMRIYLPKGEPQPITNISDDSIDFFDFQPQGSCTINGRHTPRAELSGRIAQATQTEGYNPNQVRVGVNEALDNMVEHNLGENLGAEMNMRWVTDSSAAGAQQPLNITVESSQRTAFNPTQIVGSWDGQTGVPALANSTDQLEWTFTIDDDSVIKARTVKNPDHTPEKPSFALVCERFDASGQKIPFDLAQHQKELEGGESALKVKSTSLTIGFAKA